METMLAIIVTLSLSIGLGSCLSYYLTMKLMRTAKVKKMMEETMDDYAKLIVDVSTKAAIDATKKVEEMMSEEDED